MCWFDVTANELSMAMLEGISLENKARLVNYSWLPLGVEKQASRSMTFNHVGCNVNERRIFKI